MRTILLLLAMTQMTWAGPPMKSNDPFTPEYGQFEINLAGEFEHQNDTSWHVPIIDFNYGILPDVQLTIETAYLSSPNEDDFDATKVALKWHLYHGSAFDLALYPTYNSYPIDSIFDEGETFEMAVPMSYRFDEALMLVIAPSYIYPLEGEGHIELGSYLQYDHQRHRAYFELFFEEDETHDDVFTLLNLGYMFQFHPNVAFILSLGRELHAKEATATIGYSGLQFVF